MDEKETGGTPVTDQNPGVLFDVYTWIHDLCWCLIFVTILFVFAVRLVGVDGHSMDPTLNDRDKLIVQSNFTYTPAVGDVVVLKAVNFEEEPIVKRVIAKAGQTVDINFDAGTVSVDGQVLDEPYIAEPTYRSEGTEFPLTVPAGCIFVMGDNRNNSTDSRYPAIGCVDERYVLGRAMMIIWPFDRFGAVASAPAREA